MSRQTLPYRIGLTGGIASGKSTVSALFEQRGAAVVDTDIVAREVVAPGSPALNNIEQAFGAAVIQENGGLDRAALRKIVFDDSSARQRLEAILHPLIREETLRQASQQQGPYQLIVVPLLVESPLRHEVERILVVDCTVETQTRRLLARDAESLQQAERMIAAQASREQRLAIADDVIRNNDDLDYTQSQVWALDTFYKALSKTH